MHTGELLKKVNDAILVDPVKTGTYLQIHQALALEGARHGSVQGRTRR